MLRKALGLMTGGGWWPLAAAFLVGCAAAGWLQQYRVDSITVERDTYHDRIENPDDGYKRRVRDLDATIVERNASIDRLNKQIARLANAWSDSRLQAMEAEAETKRRSGAYENYIAKLKEESSDPNADPVGLAGRTFERLQCIRDARAAGAAAGGC